MAKRVVKGKAFNIGPGMVLFKGKNPNKTDDIDVGPNNPEQGISVDNNEVGIGFIASKDGKSVTPISNTIKILSNQPMLGGVSPVQLLYGGMAPDKVFTMQEQYKDIHGINDDGSKQYAKFGIRKKFQGGGEDKNEKPKKRSAIAYGDNVSTRLRYLNLDKKLVAYINHVAKQYNISPALLASRLSSEGIIDKHIQYLDANRDKDITSLLEHMYTSGYKDYGLDDTFSLYKKGKLNLRRKIPFQKDINVNEHNRVVNSVIVKDPYDGIELMAANLEYFGKEIKNKFPNLKNKDLDTAIAKAYNMGLYGAINDISKNGVGNKYKINDGYYNINYNNDIYLQNKDKTYNINKFTIDEQNKEISDWTDVYNSNVDYARKYNNAQLYPPEGLQKEWAKKHAIKTLTEGDYQFAYPIGITDYTYNNPFANVDFSFKFGGRKQFQVGGEDDVLMRINSEGNLIDSIQPSVVTAKLPAKFNGSQAAAARYAEGYKFSKKITQQRDNVTKQVVDKLLPTNPNKDLDDNVLGYTPIVGDILQGVQGVKDFNKGNYLKGTVGLGLLVVPNILEKPVKAAIKYGSYKIKNLSGYMLKSLMRNNPLEKQLSKTGTINVDNVKTLINKGSDVEKSVVDKVLTSEQFAGKKAIDYNDFRKAVQDELITYKRNRDARYEDYGLDRLFADPAGGSAGWYFNVEPTTYTFSSPRILQGSGKHYSENTLGHSRTYTTKSEPDVLHVMESQSDWAQENVVNNRLKEIAKAEERYPGSFKARRERAINNAEKEIKNWENMIESGVNGVGEKLEPWQIENIRTDYLYNAKQRLNDLKAKYSDVTPQEKYLSDNYTTHQIQENLRIAATHGQTKMRYPTRETAAKIEGYPQAVEPSLRELSDAAVISLHGEKPTPYTQELFELRGKLDVGVKNDIITDADIQKYKSKIKKLEKLEELWKKGETTYSSKFEGILSKYSDFVNQYKKLYKNADVRTVSDKMGNTWYEVDVPKDYLNQEWKFKFGGQTNINSLGERPNAKYGKEMSNPVKKVNRYFKRKLEEENPKMSFPEKLHRNYEQLMSPPSSRNFRKRPYEKYELDKPKIQTDTTNKSENKRTKALTGKSQFHINNLPTFNFTTPNTFDNLNKPFYPTYVDGPLVGLRVPQIELNIPPFSTNFTPKFKASEIDPFMGYKPAFGTLTTKTQKTNPTEDLTKSSGLFTTKMPTISPYKDRFGNNIDLLKGTVYKDNNINLLTGKVNSKSSGLSTTTNLAGIDQYGNTIDANGQITKLAAPKTKLALTNPVKNPTKSSGLSTTAMSAIGAGINTLGSLIGSGIQQYAINNIKAPQRQYTLFSPVKLKTKININPQIARMREMQAQIADAARRTSGSSRTAYQKILAGHNRLLDSTRDLYGRKENIETELINHDRLNQQQVAQANATNVMNAINYNNDIATEINNRKQIATSNNWTNALNTTAGAWAGPKGFVDRANALRVKAGELYTQAIANPTTAKLLYGNINFATDADKRKAFNTIYDFLNNSRLG